MVCNLFSRNERFHIVKLRFARRSAQIEKHFRKVANVEKSPQIQTGCADS